MKNHKSPSEILKRFLNSDSAYINAVFEEFNNMIGEGPTINEYFDLFEKEFEILNDSITCLSFEKININELEYLQKENSISINQITTESINSINIHSDNNLEIYSESDYLGTAA